MTKCTGCGAVSPKELCERCFRIKNYNDYKVIETDNSKYIEILKNIAKTNDLVVLVVDIFNFNLLTDIKKYISNDILLVLTKRDLMLKSVGDEKLLNYDFGLDFVDKVIISTNKNYNYDLLLCKIKSYQKSNKVYVIGYTNAGKSSMINKLIYNYTDLDVEITTSPLPSTTIDTVEIPLTDNLTLIDTPGLIDFGNMTNYVSSEVLKKITPKKEIKPITYQINVKQTLIIDDLLRIDTSNVNLTFFMSNSLEINRVFKETEDLKNLTKHVIYAHNEDVVINGLGFIKVTGKATLEIYTLANVTVFKREYLI